MNIPELRLELIDKTNNYSPIDDWIITLDDGLELIFPKRFITDLASIPTCLWSLPYCKPQGPLKYGSLPHDLGYQYQYLLSIYSKKRIYPEASLRLREEYAKEFGDLVPVFVGRRQRFFDDLLAGITIAATGKKFVARSAEIALHIFGGSAWNKYREIGPTAFNSNSLGLPGLTSKGPVF